MITKQRKHIIINDLHLPLRLQMALESGGWTRPGEGYSGRWHEPSKLSAFGKIFARIENPLPQLFSFEAMQRVNEIWKKRDFISNYLGIASSNYPPGDIDPTKAIIIGESEPGSPIALDYRTPTPRVIYFCEIDNESLWVEVFESVDTLIEDFDLA